MTKAEALTSLVQGAHFCFSKRGIDGLRALPLS